MKRNNSINNTTQKYCFLGMLQWSVGGEEEGDGSGEEEGRRERVCVCLREKKRV